MILTYNNQDMVDQALNKIPLELFSNIFVSDDCSIDKTADIYEEKAYQFLEIKKIEVMGEMLKTLWRTQY